MSIRRRLERESLEIYLVYLTLAYRRLIALTGMLVLVYAVVPMTVNLVAGNLLLAPAVFFAPVGELFQRGAPYGSIQRMDCIALVA